MYNKKKVSRNVVEKITKKQEKPSINLFITIKNIYKQKHFLDNKINIS